MKRLGRFGEEAVKLSGVAVAARLGELENSMAPAGDGEPPAEGEKLPNES